MAKTQEKSEAKKTSATSRKSTPKKAEEAVRVKHNVDGVYTTKEKAARDIENKYQRKYDEDKAKVAELIKSYEDRLDELKSMLVDASDIDYRLDITIKYLGG